MALFLVTIGIAALLCGAHLALRANLHSKPLDQVLARVLWSLVILFPAGHGIVYYSAEFESNQAGPTASLAVLQPYFSDVAHVIALLLAALILVVSPAPRSNRSGLMAIAGFIGVPVAISSYFNGAASSAYGIFTAICLLVALAKSATSLDSVVQAIRHPLRAYAFLTGILIVIDPAVSFVPPEAVDRSLLGVSSRLMGPMTGPNHLALMLVLLIGVEWSNRTRRSGFFLLVAYVMLVWTQARIPLLIGAILLLAMVFSKRFMRAASNTLAASRFLSFLALFLLFLPLAVVGTQNQEVVDFTTGRVPAWRLGLELFEESPLYGHGPSTYATDATDMRVTDLGLRNAHSQLFESLATYGLLGAISTVIVVRMLTAQGARLLQVSNAVVAAPLLVFSLRLPVGTPLLLGGMTVNLAALAILVGLIVAINRQTGSSDTQEQLVSVSTTRRS